MKVYWHVEEMDLKGKKDMHRKKFFMCVVVFWLFRKQLYGKIKGCKILYFMEQFCFCITCWYGCVCVMSLTSVMISRNCGPVICFQFPWSGWNLYMLNFQLNNPTDTAECIKCFHFFFNVYCISHLTLTFSEFFTPGWNYSDLSKTICW